MAESRETDTKAGELPVKSTGLETRGMEREEENNTLDLYKDGPLIFKIPDSASEGSKLGEGEGESIEGRGAEQETGGERENKEASFMVSG